MRSVRFNIDHSENDVIRFEAGKTYPLTEETRRFVDLNMAEEVETPDVQPATPEAVKPKVSQAPAKAPSAEKTPE